MIFNKKENKLNIDHRFFFGTYLVIIFLLGISLFFLDAHGGADAVTLGTGATAAGDDAVAVGHDATASENDTVAIGHNASATSFNSVAIGRNSNVTDDDSIALGSAANTTGEVSIAIGADAQATANQTMAIGYLANASQVGSIAIGIDTRATGENSMAIGPLDGYTVASGRFSAAVGPGSNSTGDGSIALGQRAFATHQNSVAIGSFSTTSAANTVSVGSGNATDAYGTRRITNVADPVDAQDAATRGYVDTEINNALGFDRTGIQNQVNKLDRRISNVGAMQMAVANANVQIPEGKNTAIGIGMGSYQGSKAASMGITTRMPGRLKGLQFSGNFTIANAGEKAGGVGIGYTF